MDWPHAPVHRLGEAGAYMVTAATCHKEPLFGGSDRLGLLHDKLLCLAGRYGWQLQAWAVFPNHYHFVALSPEDAEGLRRFAKHLHADTARELNKLDDAPGRQVWFEFWDTHLTYERSYLARLAYVHNNPVHHGVVPVASRYRWCSAAWFEREAEPAFYRRVMALPVDRVVVPDVFPVLTDAAPSRRSAADNASRGRAPAGDKSP